ncbi:MAG: RNase adapter RapZ [Lachnospiraceae bacterium]|nr:RNase adapter RapZ [Lachnospiraceae bacterium]MBR4058319.1 RNase adapter RapZ [Lachnospiraceae bacterium]
MRFVVVTGMSGGGKTTAMKMLEDAGYYCVDNLPISLLTKFVELMVNPTSEITKVALGIDVRAGQDILNATDIFAELKKQGYQYEILFMDAADHVLLKRYKETRRVHPMAPAERVEVGISKEREMLADIYKQADYVIDTTSLLTRELKEELDHIFVQNEGGHKLIVTVLSFGFKNGIPADADLVFDVRFLPNPFYIDELKHQTGNDKPVQDYVMSFEEAGCFLDKLTEMLEFLIPNYIKEGKYRLVLGIGCTGGKHRSVTLANEIYNKLKELDICGVTLQHRDVITGK